VEARFGKVTWGLPQGPLLFEDAQLGEEFTDS
jgi:hypothetical protein